MTGIVSTPPARVPTLAVPGAPVWRTYGGGGLVVGGVMLLAATIVEWAYAGLGAADRWLLVAYGILFVAALTILAGSTIALALGASGRDGIVRGSRLGRIGLIGYGTLFLASQSVQLVWRFAEIEALGGVALVLSVLQIACGITAAVVILRAGTVHGFARIVLFVSVAIGLVAGLIANAGGPLEAVMIGFCVSAASIAVVGTAYLPQRAAQRRRMSVS